MPALIRRLLCRSLGHRWDWATDRPMLAIRCTRCHLTIAECL